MAQSYVPFGQTHITTNTTTLVRSGPGFLYAVNVNTTAAGTITIYDGIDANGTVIAVLKTSVEEHSYIYEVAVSKGITVVTAASSDITVVYA